MDRYFAYLDRVAGHWPAGLRDFACDEARYALNGPHTLHDAWLCQLRVDKRLDAARKVDTTVSLTLELAADSSQVQLQYEGVTALNLNLTPEYCADQPVDLLVHEFTQHDAGQVQHLLQFVGGVYIEIGFRQLQISSAGPA